MQKGKLGLSMIVKNEAKVIRRCLESVKPFISYWVICDTGSIDDTMQIIREVMEGVPGELIEQSWVNWGYNRTVPYLRAKEHTEYTLGIFDADEILVVKDPAALAAMHHDSYGLWRSLGSIDFVRKSIFKNSLPWRFEGEHHELAVLPDGMVSSEGDLKGKVFAQNYADGHAWSDPMKAIERYTKEAERFKAEVERDPNNARAQFYLAQSYHDSLQNDLAIQAWLRRADMGGFNEEVYLSLVYAGRTMANVMNAPANEIRDILLRAHGVIPERAEAMFVLGRYYREKVNDFQLAQIYLRQAAAIPEPDVMLFHEKQIYTWMAKDELAVALTRCARWAEASSLLAGLIEHGPEHERSRYVEMKAMCDQWLGNMVVDVPRAAEYVAPGAPTAAAPPEPLPFKLNLGCGNAVRPGFHNVDQLEPCNEVVDLAMPWPWLDSSVDAIVAENVFEYIADHIFLMNEAWRVMKPSAVLSLVVPDAAMAGPIVDPMQRSQWTEELIAFFDHTTEQHKKYAKAYGILAKFEIVSYGNGGETNENICVTLRAVK